MIIIASGLSGTGKSVLCEKLARYFRLRYVPASGIYKKVREEKLSEMHIGQLKKNVGWWESAEGQRFMEKRLKDPKFDRAVDNTLLRMIEKGKKVCGGICGAIERCNNLFLLIRAFVCADGFVFIPRRNCCAEICK